MKKGLKKKDFHGNYIITHYKYIASAGARALLCFLKKKGWTWNCFCLQTPGKA